MSLLLFPNQLFDPSLFPKDVSRIFLVEDPLFFSDLERTTKCNRLKLIWHRATMKAYELELKDKYQVQYIEYKNNFSYDFIPDDFCIFDVVDHLLLQRLSNTGKTMTVYQSPAFILSPDDHDQYKSQSNGNYDQTSFYSFVRNNVGLLLDHNNKPFGGKLTYDTENRRGYPRSGLEIKTHFNDRQYIGEAIEYIKNKFGDSLPGPDWDQIVMEWPITRVGAYEHLQKFFDERLELFGPYQDAISKEDPFIYHSTISPLLNCGLLDPYMIVDKANRLVNKISIASLEGFVRQIAGWREFCYFMYRYKYQEMISSNYLNAHNKLNSKYFYGHEKIGIPILDDAIRDAWNTGYLHHIRRLMVVANFFALCDIEPSMIYKWFLEFSLDAYDWVMVFNVYAMGCYAYPDTTTKPYVSGSNYLLKMSNYESGPWTQDWDDLFYNFLNSKKELLRKSGRMGLMLRLLDRKDDIEIKKQRANQIIKRIMV